MTHPRLLSMLTLFNVATAGWSSCCVEPARATGGVTFEAGARTAWHTHPLGQTLIVTAGCRRAQRWGGPILAALITPSATASLHEKLITPTSRPLKNGVIGAGSLGGTVGRIWAKAGHTVAFSSRNPQRLMPLVNELVPNAIPGTPRQAAEFGSVVLFLIYHQAPRCAGA